jgi:ATP-dependent DNA ligase
LHFCSEGVIPDGEYGAGTVMVWDTGTFQNVSKQDHQEVTIIRALESGRVAVWLQGKKLRVVTHSAESLSEKIHVVAD